MSSTTLGNGLAVLSRTFLMRTKKKICPESGDSEQTFIYRRKPSFFPFRHRGIGARARGCPSGSFRGQNQGGDRGGVLQCGAGYLHQIDDSFSNMSTHEFSASNLRPGFSFLHLSAISDPSRPAFSAICESALQERGGRCCIRHARLPAVWRDRLFQESSPLGSALPRHRG